MYFSFWSCISPDLVEDQDGRILAEVNSKILYSSDIENLIHRGTSTYDSSAIANSYVDRWVKDELLIGEAQSLLANDPELQSLVEDYRNRLIKHKYENQVIEEKLDTSIQKSEIFAFYDKTKVNYILKEPVYRILYVAVPDKTNKIDRLYNAWINDDLEFVKEYSALNADKYFVELETWVTLGEIRELVPELLIKSKSLDQGTIIQQNIDHIEYFFKVVDVRLIDDFVPLELVVNKLRRIIIHERKEEVLAEYKEELYEKAKRLKIVNYN